MLSCGFNNKEHGFRFYPLAETGDSNYQPPRSHGWESSGVKICKWSFRCHATRVSGEWFAQATCPPCLFVFAQHRRPYIGKTRIYRNAQGYLTSVAADGSEFLCLRPLDSSFVSQPTTTCCDSSNSSVNVDLLHYLRWDFCHHVFHLLLCQLTWGVI